MKILAFTHLEFSYSVELNMSKCNEDWDHGFWTIKPYKNSPHNSCTMLKVICDKQTKIKLYKLSLKLDNLDSYSVLFYFR